MPYPPSPLLYTVWLPRVQHECTLEYGVSARVWFGKRVVVGVGQHEPGAVIVHGGRHWCCS